MKRKVIAITGIMLLLLMMMTACSKSSFGLVVNDDNTISITAENAEDGSAASGVIEVGDNQMLKGEPDLSTDGTIRLDIYEGDIGLPMDPSEEDIAEKGTPLASIMLTGQDFGAVGLEPGTYTVVANVEGKVTGTATVKTVPKA